MAALSSFKLLTKILAMLGILTALTLGSIMYVTYEMCLIGDAENAIMNDLDQANIALARGIRGVSGYYAGIDWLIIATSETGNRAPLRAIEAGAADAVRSIEIAQAHGRQLADKAGAISRAFAAAREGVCAQTIGAGMSAGPAGKVTAAELMAVTCGPALAGVIENLRQVAAESTALAEKTTADLSALVGATVRQTIGVILASLLIIFSVAVYLSHIGGVLPVAQPVAGAARPIKVCLAKEPACTSTKRRFTGMANAAIKSRGQGTSARELEAA